MFVSFWGSYEKRMKSLVMKLVYLFLVDCHGFKLDTCLGDIYGKLPI